MINSRLFATYRKRLEAKLKEDRNSKLWKGVIMFYHQTGERHCSPKEVVKYENTRFDGVEVAYLIYVDCSLEEAERYDPRFKGLDISILYAIGLKPDKISPNKQKRLFDLFKKITKSVKRKLGPYDRKKSIKRDYTGKFTFLGTGVSGVVLLRDNNAWKFAGEINKEYSLLKKIQDHHKGCQKNLIKVKGKSKEGIALEIEYIQGDSLESILEKQTPSLEEEKSFLSKKEVIKYASDIMNGLIEMREAGIWYHRDIRPANILIDKENDRAIIIDFGIATTDRNALPKDNRRYGGVNDLIALGQVMYKMATGNHIFAKSKSMERVTQAQRIKDYRDKVYSDKTGKLLEKHLKQVDKKIEDEQLKTLIKTCLTAKDYEYKKIQRMIKEFSNTKFKKTFEKIF